MAITCAYVAGYVLLDWVSYIHPIAPYAITPWNPPPGLSLTLLLAVGLRFAPALFIAAVLAEIVVRGTSATGIAETVGFASIPAFGYTAIAVALLRWFKFDASFKSMRDLWVFTITVGIGSMIIAALYIGAHIVAGRFAWDHFSDYALAFWVGDVIGVLVTTPFLMTRVGRFVERQWRVEFEALLQSGAILVTVAFVFSTGDITAPKLFYLLFLPLIWVCVRSGFDGATVALLVTQVALIVAVQVAGYTGESMLEFQALMLTLAITGAFLGMAVSEWKRASQSLETREVELSRAMRVAAAAEMASALAHELNQPLTAASNYVQSSDIILRDAADAPPVLRSVIAKAWAELQRAGEVVHRLRQFYRGGEGRREPTEVSVLFERSIQPLRGRLDRHRIKLVTGYVGDAPSVLVDQIQVEMVLHNLVANAIDSVKPVAEGNREIALRAYREGAVVTIEVQDTGGGVSPAIASQIFRTFVTSKPAGMGLGLAMSRSIVEAHGGRLWLDESTTRGARFALTLPAAEQ